MELKYMPLGTVKRRPVKYWRDKAYAIKGICLSLSITSFFLGVFAGMIISSI